jgi:hypothetical protein
VKARREAPDGFYRHLREWFTAFLPRQRGAAGNTITSCRQTWNMLLGYVAEHHHVAVEKVTFAMLDRATVTGFLDHMQATKSWTASTRNQRLACIRSFFTYAAAAEPALAIYLADLADYARFCVQLGIRYLAVMDGDAATPAAQNHAQAAREAVSHCGGGELFEFPHTLEATFGAAKQKPSLVPDKIRELPFAGNVPDPAQAPPEVVKLAEAIRSLAG